MYRRIYKNANPKTVGKHQQFQNDWYLTLYEELRTQGMHCLYILLVFGHKMTKFETQKVTTHQTV